MLTAFADVLQSASLPLLQPQVKLAVCCAVCNLLYMLLPSQPPHTGDSWLKLSVGLIEFASIAGEDGAARYSRTSLFCPFPKKRSISPLCRNSFQWRTSPQSWEQPFAYRNLRLSKPSLITTPIKKVRLYRVELGEMVFAVRRRPFSRSRRSSEGRPRGRNASVFPSSSQVNCPAPPFHLPYRHTLSRVPSCCAFAFEFLDIQTTLLTRI